MVGACDIRDARLVQTLEEEMTAMSWVVSVALLVLFETGSVQSATGANADPTKGNISKYRTLYEKPCEAEYQPKDEQAVACIIKRPYKAKMLRAIRIGQQG
jgi:hypothetical protein